MKKIKIGILGCADIAYRLMIPAIKKHHGYKLISVASRDFSKAKKFAKKFNCLAEKEYQSIIENNEIEAVYIPLPNGVREYWILKALKAHKHVLSEKSIVMNLNSARKIIKCASNHKNRIIFENFMFLNHCQHNFVLNKINEGLIGEIISINSNFSIPKPNSNNIRLKKNLGSGALYDLGSYNIRLAIFLLGKELKLVNYDKIEIKGIDTYGFLTLKNKQNQYAVSQFGFGSFYQNTYEVHGTNGKIIIKRAFSMPSNETPEISIFTSKKKKVYKLNCDDQFYNTLTKFYNDVLKNEYKNNYLDIINQSKIIDTLLK